MRGDRTRLGPFRVQRGLTLLEIVVASVIGALMAGGTMAAFLSATRNSRASLIQVNATSLAQQTLERFRNKVACRNSTEVAFDTWYNALCEPDPPPCPPTGWCNDMPLGTSEEWITKLDPNATRQYKVTLIDCGPAP